MTYGDRKPDTSFHLRDSGRFHDTTPSAIGSRVDNYLSGLGVILSENGVGYWSYTRGGGKRLIMLKVRKVVIQF